MVEEKVITPVLKPTEWCAPVVIVPKSDGNVRICVDLIELNKNVMRELRPLPKAEYSLNVLTGAKIFSKLDAISGFWQIPLGKKSSYLTTFITPFGRFRFQRLPFGISSAPEHFQRRMFQMLEGKETTVTTDASSYGLGATICQKQADGRRSVIAYASRILTPTESRYAQIEKEALSVVWGCEKFRDYLTGMHFKIETDHKPLIPIFSEKNLDDLSPRLQRIKLRMMKFSYTIVHIPGKELFAADALSRNPQKVPYKSEELEAEIDAFVQMITSSLPASSRRLDELRVAQLKMRLAEAYSLCTERMAVKERS
ncbi:Transposon Ty3-I Gag-Pol polyprotein [Araneus ventricosus]|uniref:Transposon Ty3-I Gag-Pol polyprotein n=1 Tax=Araneus ventricosus TaxID=182803 RepID=A0A4Y2HDX7_ARAVE|nr:Transposon Ty3-I Gag-Pol polyprotein [Araneus ventricosus]